MDHSNVYDCGLGGNVQSGPSNAGFFRQLPIFGLSAYGFEKITVVYSKKRLHASDNEGFCANTKS
ncbi:MAG TPA: hypothetical protein DDZ51_04650 [Planctomycetaceae bacterium]|nr:hypothetical protein [Planctomycetaceae bacterium]